MPLANATGTPTNDYIATGVAESLTTSLAAMSGVVVVSRAAVTNAANRDSEPAAVARELGATYLVEGSVQLSGARVRLSVNLVRPDRSVVWADSVEGLFGDIFGLQSRLASALARALSVQISAAERAKLARQPTANADALAAYYRGRAQLDRSDVKGNTEAALAAFDEAVRLDPDFAVAHAARAEALWTQYSAANDPAIAQEAVAAATNALRLDPDSAQTRYSMALALSRTGRSNEAVEELQRALALQPTHDDARQQLAQILARQGRLEEAISEYRKAIAIRPTYWRHHSALGVSLYQAARYDEAVEALKRAAELQPDNASLHQQLGTVYQVMGRQDDAVAAYERANAIQPLPAAYGNLGALYHIRGEYAKAVEAYRAAIKLRPNAPVTYRNLGDSYRRLGRESEAVAAYRQAIQLTEQMLQVNRRNPLTLGSLAVMHAKVGEHDAALARVREAETLAPNDVQVMFYAAVVHALARRPDDALRQLRRAVDNGFSRTQIQQEEDFATLTTLPAFKALVAQPSPGGSKP
jgi:tetratricopeptide (TPR) repeat protein